MKMKNNLRILVLFVLLYGSMNSIFSQTYYETGFQELQDEKYYPQIDRYIQARQNDSLLHLSEKVFDFYYDKGEKDKAIYHFNLCVVFPVKLHYVEKTIPYINKRIEFLQSKNDTLNVHYGYLLSIKALAHIRLFQYDRAWPFFEQAIYVLENAENTPNILLIDIYRQAAFLNAYLYNNRRGYQLANRALEGYLSLDTKGLPKQFQNQIAYEIAYSYITLGVLMKQTGQIELAYEYNKKAYEMYSTLPKGKENMVNTSNNMANNCLDLDKPHFAIKYAKIADSITKANNFESKLKMTYISVLYNKGLAYFKLGKYAKAHETYQELENFITKEVKPGHPLHAEPHIFMAEGYMEQEILDSALVYYKIAIENNAISPSIPGSMYRIFIEKQQYKLAMEFAKKDMTLYLDNTKDRNFKHLPSVKNITDYWKGCLSAHRLANSYYFNYKQNENKKYLDTCIYYVNLADSLLKRHRDATMIGGNDLKLAETYHDIANTGIKACYMAYKNDQEQAYIDNILAFLTHSTAFKFNAEVKQAELFSKGEKKNLALKQIHLLKRIRKMENELLALKGSSNSHRREILEEKLFEDKRKAFNITFTLQHYHGSFLDSLQAFYIHLDKVQKEIQENEAIIAYFMGEEAIYSLFITPKEVKVSRKEKGKAFDQNLMDYYRSLKTGSNDLKAHAVTLYDYLLEPFSDRLEDVSKLTVIPDGALNQIPFETLLDGEDKNKAFLIEKMAVSYNYSIYLWLKNQSKEQKDDLNFIGFAPVFSDVKIELDSLNPLSYNQALRSAYPDIRDGNNLAPIPYTAAEIIDIQKLFINKDKKARIFLHNEASEKNLKSNLKGHSIVHIATHGFSSEEDPSLSGLFMYENIENDSTNITNDGFIHLGEIFTLDSDAKLVVLSACKTGTGKISKGEGVLALPKAFIFAGVPNLMASLWKIHDEKTKNLMIDFYRRVLDGKNYSEALRAAKIQQIENGETPLDWSGIVLIGN
jgi:CHAT domain-containing protein